MAPSKTKKKQKNRVKDIESSIIDTLNMANWKKLELFICDIWFFFHYSLSSSCVMIVWFYKNKSCFVLIGSRMWRNLHISTSIYISYSKRLTFENFDILLFVINVILSKTKIRGSLNNNNEWLSQWDNGLGFLELVNWNHNAEFISTM